MIAQMIQVLSSIMLTAFVCGCATNEPTNKSFEISAVEAKAEFLNDIKRSFSAENIEHYQHVTFTNYGLRFTDGFPHKLMKIASELKREDVDFFMLQVNEYEKLELQNKDIDFDLQGFKNISKSELSSLGTTYEELWKTLETNTERYPF